VTSVEFALILFPFLLLLLGTFDLGRYFLTLHSVSAFANAAARYCLVNYNFETYGVFVSASSLSNPNLADAAPFLDPTVLQVSATCQPVTFHPADLGDGLQQRTVTAQYPFQPITPGLDLLDTTITQTVTFDY
jgi:Flp pilus assembly protein TadG